LYRIPGLISEKQPLKGKTPILVYHGLLFDMMMWFFNYPDDQPAIILAKAGYDVWLGNQRGNFYSYKHIKLDPWKDNEYWNFSWEEMGTKDAPAVIDYILKATGKEKLSYMGHSQGTTMLLAGTSMNPDYFNSKINGAILLAPATSLFYNHFDKGWQFYSNRFVANSMIKFSKYMHWMNWFPYG
jgi:lysosomal acid lipase/cholesteryl ester hydrolase